MWILLLLNMFLIIKMGLQLSHCDIEYPYYNQYGYGSSIKCKNISHLDKELKHISAHNAIILNISQSNLTNPEKSIFFNVKGLKILHVIKSTVLLKPSVEVFSEIDRLEELHIINSNFAPINQNTFKYLTNLKRLTLKNTSLTVLSAGVFKHLGSLIYLNLSNNKFKSLKSVPLCELPQLKTLILSGNEINSLEDFNFACAESSNSFSLDLNNNSYSVATFHNVFQNQNKTTSSLVEIDLSNNEIENLGYAFQHVRFLRKVNLANNRIKILHGHEFQTLNYLSNLNLNNNLLEEVNMVSFLPLNEIESIDLHGNKIRNLVIKNNSKLKVINLSSNYFNVTNIKSWKDLAQLDYLDLSHNDIRSITSDIFQQVASVKFLNLSNNLINLKNDSLDIFENVTNINLSKNAITYLPFEIFSQLKEITTIDISQNLLQSIDLSIFRELANLESLNLSYNLLTNLTNSLVKPMESLEILDFESNKLENIDLSIFSSFPSLRTINVKNNKFTCDFVKHLLQFFVDKHIMYTAEKEENLYAQENVGGIPCNHNTIIKSTASNLLKPETGSNSILIIVICGLLAIIIAGAIILYKWRQYFRRKLEFLTDNFELMDD